MLKGAGFGISSILAISLTFLVNPYSFAEEQQEKQETQEIKQQKSLSEKVKDVMGMQEAYAMTVPAPSISKAIMQINPLFLGYINNPPLPNNGKPRREELENAPVYKMYYKVDDKKEQIEERIMQGINKSRWKEKAGIDKISTKFRDDDLRLQVRFKERGKKQGYMTIRKSYEDERVDVSYSVRF